VFLQSTRDRLDASHLASASEALITTAAPEQVLNFGEDRTIGTSKLRPLEQLRIDGAPLRSLKTALALMFLANCTLRVVSLFSFWRFPRKS